MLVARKVSRIPATPWFYISGICISLLDAALYMWNSQQASAEKQSRDKQGCYRWSLRLCRAPPLQRPLTEDNTNVPSALGSEAVLQAGGELPIKGQLRRWCGQKEVLLICGGTLKSGPWIIDPNYYNFPGESLGISVSLAWATQSNGSQFTLLNHELSVTCQFNNSIINISKSLQRS